MNSDRRDDPSTYTLAIIGLIAIAALTVALVAAYVKFDNKFEVMERRIARLEIENQILSKTILLINRKQEDGPPPR